MDVDIASNFEKIFSLQTGFTACGYSITKELGEITFANISLLNKLSVDVYGSWDDNAYVYINNIKVARVYANYWLNVMGGPIRPYDHYDYTVDLSSFIPNIINASSNNLFQVKATYANDSNTFGCGGSANGFLKIKFSFKSKRL